MCIMKVQVQNKNLTHKKKTNNRKVSKIVKNLKIWKEKKIPKNQFFYTFLLFAEKVSRWRCVLIINNLIAHYNSQFCVRHSLRFNAEVTK